MKYHNNIVNISSLNPDYMGFIFWDKSKRKMELDAIPEIPKTIKKVGVFVNAYFYEIVEKVHEYKLDFVQLHGNESPTLCKDLKEEKIKVIKAFSIDNDFDFKNVGFAVVLNITFYELLKLLSFFKTSVERSIDVREETDQTSYNLFVIGLSHISNVI